MSKIPTDCERHALNGPTMGTRWSAVFHAPAVTDPEPVRAALAEAVDVVDRQMSTWQPDSDLMRINRAPVGTWLPAPADLMQVLSKGLEIGQLSDGAFDIGMGDVVTAWGFGPQEADTQAIRTSLGKAHARAHEHLELDRDALLIRKLAPITLDLSGIAKGYAVDQMMKVLHRLGIENALVGVDGEMRARGLRPDGRPWTIAVERPDYEGRAPLSIVELNDSAVATSGDYRHWVDAGPQRLSHTMDPARGGPLTDAAASVTVLTETCMEADAWATALMVAGTRKATLLVKKHALAVLFVHRDGNALRQTHIGWNV
tara:strand:- start:3481 stop:4425 length:945 start_codon:yes stop_codon:yes gene_type:complete